MSINPFNVFQGKTHHFTPNVDIKEELARTSVSITCYDRNGNIVKRITSTDEGNVEDPENTTPDGGDENEGPDII